VIDRPSPSEFAPAFAGYVARVTEADVMDVLARQTAELRALAVRVPAEHETFRYEPGKWTIREVVGHVGDAERVMGYRAFSISRGEQASLPGFEENDYVANSPFARVPLAELVDEFAALRAGNLAVLSRADGTVAAALGTANGTRVSVRALAYILAGHFRHHVHVLETRYGI
jgi:hypothetical protein